MKTFFDPATHTYFINDRPVPSVTQILRDLIPGWSASDWYMERGQSIHACAALIVRGKQFEYDPQIENRIVALRRFFAEVRPVVLGVEMQVYSERWQYAGTLDLLTYKPGSDQLIIVDFKSSFTPSVPYQCAAYAEAFIGYVWPQTGIKDGRHVRWGCGVEIKEDGKYRMGKVTDLRPYKAKFLGLLSAYNSRRECGIIIEEEQWKRNS